MFKRKKAEGSASSFLIALLLGLGSMVVIGSLIVNSASLYSVDNIDEFDGFNDTLSDVKLVGGSFTSSIDSTNQSNSDYNTAEDLTFASALKAMRTLPSLTKSVADSIAGTLGIPSYIIAIITLILAITLIALIFQVIRGFNNV